MMNKALAVARWEYLEKIKSKSFIIGLFLTPLLMIVSAVLPSIMMSHEDDASKIIGIIDATGKIERPLAEALTRKFVIPGNKGPRYVLRPIASGQGIDVASAVAEGTRLVVAGSIEGYCVVRPDTGSVPAVEYRSTSVGDMTLNQRLESTLNEILSDQKAVEKGVSPELMKQLNIRLDVKTVKLSKTGGEEEGNFLKQFFTGYGVVMIFMMLMMTSGQMLVRSIIEEKSNRIVEILVSSVTPSELMVGKVVGLSGIGLTQIGFWVLVGVGAALQFGVSIFDWLQALLIVIYFVLGYLFYAALFIAAGSPLSREQDMQQMMQYLVFPLVTPIIVAMPAMQNPGAAWIKVLSFIPLMTTSMMSVRIPVQMPEWWEIGGTIAVLLVSTYVTMIAAGRIFRIAILSTGKTPSLKELLRWARKG
jgi:ABC-2 type transport system permease protein